MTNAPDNWAITHYNHGQTPAAARRERIAVAMMAAVLSNVGGLVGGTRPDLVARKAMQYAAAIIAELEEGGEG